MMSRKTMRSVECHGGVALVDLGSVIIPSDCEEFTVKMHYDNRHPLGLEVSGHAVRGSNAFLTAVSRDAFLACVMDGVDTLADNLTIVIEEDYVVIVQKSTVMLAISFPLRYARKMGKAMRAMCKNADAAIEEMITRELASLETS